MTAKYQKTKQKIDKARSQGMCRDCYKTPALEGRSRCEYCAAMRQVYKTRQNRKLKAAVIEAYGGKCSCCNEAHLEFLTIDHVEGEGNAHRRDNPGNIYHWYRRHGYPPGFQVLCMNCNLSKGLYGYCPHQYQPDYAI